MTFKFKNRHHARIMEVSTIHLPIYSDTLMCDVSSGHYFFQVSKHHTPSLRQSGLIQSSWVSGGFFYRSVMKVLWSWEHIHWTRNLIRLSSACHKSDQDVPQSRAWSHHVQASCCCIPTVLVYALLSRVLSPPVGPTGVLHFLCF